MNCPKNVRNLWGMRFGRLVVTEFAGFGSSHKSQWLCLCDCGCTTIAKGNSLVTNHVKSCGCLGLEIKSKVHTAHGLRKHPLYHTWLNIKDRCYNSKNSHYKYYGGRGITICEEWKNNFKAFYEWSIEHGYKKGLSIERLDVNGNYCPQNCTWIILVKQAQNKRNSIRIKENGESLNVADCSEKFGISVSAVYSRIRRNGSMNVKRERKRAVEQYSSENKFIRAFESACEAARITGCCQSSITRCCRGLQRTSNNYIWKYKR